MAYTFFPVFFKTKNGIIFTTPNYPTPYTGRLSQRTTLSVNDSQGVAVVFEQFLASAHDCVIACPSTNDGCSSLCGDAMDHGLVPKILRVPGNATVTIVSIEPNDGFPHAGIAAKLLPYDLKKPSFFNCNDEVDLSSGETFYLISPNYPSAPTEPISGCKIKFSTSGIRQGIRLAAYDFYTEKEDAMDVSGTKISGFVTEDEPGVYYFENNALVSFNITQQNTVYPERFYILVQSYEIRSTEGTCFNTGNRDLALNDVIVLGNGQFGTNPYANNLNCAWNFTRTPGTYSLFALAIEYESEKCCDFLTIDGLSVYEYIYQGFQYSNLFFTNSRAISFLFQSDPIVGATGLNASLQHIDCTCPQSTLLVKNGVLTSPGYATTISYCPNLLCQPKVEYQDDLYDLQLQFLDFNLRSYTLDNNTDSLSIFDSYGHPLVQMQPYYLGFDSFWATVSPVTVQFISHNLASFPLDQIGRGFSIGLNLVKKDYVKESVDFNDGFIFKDISNLDLKSGKTYQFSVNGRQGHKIFVYFFTKTTSQVFVDIFDGDSMDADRIDNKALYSNIFENGPSMVLSTTTEKAIINIRGNPTFLNAGLDFQAMITDLELGRDCEPLVHSLKTVKSASDTHLQGQNCYKVLHFSDSSYSQSAFMNLWLSKNIPMQIYLGLTTYSDMLIAQNTNDPLPQDLFTNYLVLKFSTTDVISLSYSWDVSNGIVARTMGQNDTVILMSEDYGKSRSSSVIQQFSVQLEGESDVQTGLTIDFLADSGKGSGTLTWSSYNGEISKESFTSAKQSLTYQSCGNKLLVDYSSPGGGSDNGLYVKITRADLRCSFTSSHSSILVLLTSLLVLLLLAP
ncbi:unnamed protein product [Caenorhabditis sp. 36 PRJEB53466]|nr:unnamed protein product [Caenorhabditis sp. 36 PRJEB53466]